MPSFAGQLSDQQVAGIIDHERSSWGNRGGLITAADVLAVRKGQLATSRIPGLPSGRIHGDQGGARRPVLGRRPWLRQGGGGEGVCRYLRGLSWRGRQRRAGRFPAAGRRSGGHGDRPDGADSTLS